MSTHLPFWSSLVIGHNQPTQAAALGVGGASVVAVRKTAARARRSMPLSLSDLQAIAADNFADDLEIPQAALTWWSKEDAEQYFSSGGTDMPSRPAGEAGVQKPASSTASKIAVPLPPLRPPVWWTTPPTSPAAALRIDDAHAEAISRVQLFYDAEGVVGAPGEMLAASGSWDYSIRLWRVADASGAAVASARPLAELHDEAQRWIYGVGWCGVLGDGASAETPRRLGLVSTQTGGMMGEPEQLIRLWSARREAVDGDDDTTARVHAKVTMLVNTAGADARAAAAMPGNESGVALYTHRRGVHAVDIDLASGRMATVSADCLALWSLDRVAGRYRESTRGACRRRVWRPEQRCTRA